MSKSVTELPTDHHDHPDQQTKEQHEGESTDHEPTEEHLHPFSTWQNTCFEINPSRPLCDIVASLHLINDFAEILWDADDYRAEKHWIPAICILEILVDRANRQIDSFREKYEIIVERKDGKGGTRHE